MSGVSNRTEMVLHLQARRTIAKHFATTSQTIGGALGSRISELRPGLLEAGPPATFHADLCRESCLPVGSLPGHPQPALPEHVVCTLLD